MQIPPSGQHSLPQVSEVLPTDCSQVTEELLLVEWRHFIQCFAPSLWAACIQWPVDVEASHLAQFLSTVKVELRSPLQMNSGSASPSACFCSTPFHKALVEAPACESLPCALFPRKYNLTRLYSILCNSSCIKTFTPYLEPVLTTLFHLTLSTTLGSSIFILILQLRKLRLKKCNKLSRVE